VANLVVAVGEDVDPYISELLDAMFSGGLNETLIRTLTVIRWGSSNSSCSGNNSSSSSSSSSSGGGDHALTLEL